MIKIEKVETMGWDAAIRGMRNPKNSWGRSDSHWCRMNMKVCPDCKNRNKSITCIGPNDFDLMMRLRNAGTDHRKFMRMITVYLDITAPRYWWAEFDTYKVGTVANSCSTMHKIAAKEFELSDFSTEHLIQDWDDPERKIGIVFHDTPKQHFIETIAFLNRCRAKFLETSDKTYWWQLIQLLPGSYNQKRTVMLNYEVLANIYKSRKNHKLDEWREFCHWIESLPYSELITGDTEGVEAK